MISVNQLLLPRTFNFSHTFTKSPLFYNDSEDITHYTVIKIMPC